MSECEFDPSSRHLIGGGIWKIQNAASLKQTLAEAAIQSERVSIDLAGVTAMDGAGVQLLLMLDKALRDNGTALSITALSDSAEQALSDLGALHIIHCEHGASQAA